MKQWPFDVSDYRDSLIRNMSYGWGWGCGVCIDFSSAQNTQTESNLLFTDYGAICIFKVAQRRNKPVIDDQQVDSV